MILPVKDGQMHFGLSLPDMVPAWIQPRATQDGIVVPPMSSVEPARPVHTRIYRNQWIADCHFCRGTFLVWRNCQMFMCVDCWNVVVGGKWQPAPLPANYGEIECVIRARPLPINRNWDPALGMTLDQYRAENIEHGYPAEVSPDA